MKNDNKLKKINSEGIVLSLLQAAKDKNLDVYVWKFFGNSKHMGLVRIDTVRKNRNDFCLSPVEGQSSVVKDLINLQDFVDIYIPESQTLFRTKLKTLDSPQRYYLQLPSFVAQVERRKGLRLNVYDTSEVKVSFGKSITMIKTMTQHFSKSCYDISSGGLSFFVSKMELRYFQPDDSINEMEIKTTQNSIKASVVVKSILEVEPDQYNKLSYKVWRINCAFVGISAGNKKFLERFIFERIKTDLSAIS